MSGQYCTRIWSKLLSSVIQGKQLENAAAGENPLKDKLEFAAGKEPSGECAPFARHPDRTRKAAIFACLPRQKKPTEHFSGSS
jgi:hypothetical protein